MQRNRQRLFQQIVTALAHQQKGNGELALAYWENVLRLLPEELRIHNEILGECARIARGSDTPQLSQKVAHLTDTYSQKLTDEEYRLFQVIYRAMSQQANGNYALAFAFWKNALTKLSSDSIVVTLCVQDFCWAAHQYLKAGNIKECLEVYEQLLQTFSDFLEGYINLSLIKYKYGYGNDVLELLDSIPRPYHKERLVIHYKNLFQKIAEVSQYFEHVPYTAIEEIVSDLWIENTYYPSLSDEYFAEFVTELVEREKRFFEKRRRALEERAISKTSKRLAKEGIALGQRVTLAKQAQSQDIPQFLQDNDIRIAEVLLNNPYITADDVLVMAQTCSVSEVLTLITESKKWGTLHPIAIALIFNPQTFPRDSIRLLALLSLDELASVFYQKTLPTELRIRAKQKIQQKFQEMLPYEKIAAIETSRGEILKLLDEVELNLPAFLETLVQKFVNRSDIIVQICRWKLTPTDILTAMSQHPAFETNITIKFALLSNPRLPEDVMIALIQSIPQEDLRYFVSNTYLPAIVKQTIAALLPEILSSQVE